MSPLLLVACVDYNFQPDDDADSVVDTEAEPRLPEATVEHHVWDTKTDTHTPPKTDPVAEASVYAHTANQLFTVDPVTGDVSLVGGFQEANGARPTVVDIAIDLDGHMVGGTQDNRLVSVNPVTAQVAELCWTSVAMYALTFTAGGTLIAGGRDLIDIIDVEDCESFRLLDGGYETSGDLVGLPDGFLYWTVEDGANDGLVRLDPSDGSTEWVGSTGVENLFGLGYHEDSLFGFSAEGTISRISPVTASTVTLVDDGTAWWGATTNPVLW